MWTYRVFQYNHPVNISLFASIGAKEVLIFVCLFCSNLSNALNHHLYSDLQASLPTIYQKSELSLSTLSILACSSIIFGQPCNHLFLVNHLLDISISPHLQFRLGIWKLMCPVSSLFLVSMSASPVLLFTVFTFTLRRLASNFLQKSHVISIDQSEKSIQYSTFK